MKEVGIIDVDGHNYPNLALMKISAYEKGQGNQVEWWNGLKKYDRVYQAKIFDDTYTQDNRFVVQADEIIKGGTGYNLDKNLPNYIEHQYPDYSLYNISDTAFGFLTRGCPRHCGFCIVGEKEGLLSHKVADLEEFWKGQKNIEILDPNLLASKDHGELLDQLISSRAMVNFSQGLDIRVMDDETAKQINQIKTSMIHFAWDNYEFETYEKLKRYRPIIDKRSDRLRVYVLTNYNTTLQQDLERIYKLRAIDYDPFVMVYDKPRAPKEIRDLQRWCNNKWVFRTCERFEDYKTCPAMSGDVR